LSSDIAVCITPSALKYLRLTLQVPLSFRVCTVSKRKHFLHFQI
jgi:hypothetical protein